MQDQPFAVAHQVVEFLRPPGEAPVELLESFRLAGVDEHAIDQVQELVSRSAFDGPCRSQWFVVHQDLFGHYIECTAGAISIALAIGLSQRALGQAGILKIAEIFLGLEETVGMVHTQARDVAASHQIED